MQRKKRVERNYIHRRSIEKKTEAKKIRRFESSERECAGGATVDERRKRSEETWLTQSEITHVGFLSQERFFSLAENIEDEVEIFVHGCQET